MSTALTTITSGQMKDLSAALVQAIPTDLPSDVAQNWIGRKTELGDKIRIILYECLPDINWLLTYQKLGMEAEFVGVTKKLVIPTNPGLWICPMIPGVTPNKVVAGYRGQKVKVWTYHDDLDAHVTKNDRDPNRDGAYVIGFRRTIEADEENKGKSANVLAQVNHKGIVLCEHLLLGFGYYVTTYQHLDVKTRTLCAGSRFSGGCVPSVAWFSDYREVFVGWCNLGDSDGHLRSRSAVSASEIALAR